MACSLLPSNRIPSIIVLLFCQIVSAFYLRSRRDSRDPPKDLCSRLTTEIGIIKFLAINRNSFFFSLIDSRRSLLWNYQFTFMKTKSNPDCVAAIKNIKSRHYVAVALHNFLHIEVGRAILSSSSRSNNFSPRAWCTEDTSRDDSSRNRGKKSFFISLSFFFPTVISYLVKDRLPSHDRRAAVRGTRRSGIN